MTLGALAADVVTLIVIGVLAKVLLVLSGHHTTLGRLLDRQADPATLEVQVDDLHPELLARGDHLFGKLYVVGRHFRDVDQTLDPVAHLDEGTERHQLSDPAVYQLPHLVGPSELLPGILLGGLQREADALPTEVDFQHLDLDLIADRYHRAGMIDVLPGQLRDVDQAVHATQVHKGSEVDHAGHHAAANLSRPQVVEELLALLFLGLFQPGPAGQDHVVAILVQFDDLGVDRGADVRLQVTDPAQLDQRGGQEAPEADVHYEAALDDLDD